MWRFNLVALAVLLFVVGLLFTLPQRTQLRMQSVVLSTFSPFLKFSSRLQTWARQVTEGLKTLEELEEANHRLEIANKELSATNQALRGMEEENNRLRSAVEYRQRARFQLIPARIISRDASTWWSTAKIDRGSDDKVEREMPVLTEQGLVGVVTAVSPGASIVRLVTDENCKVAARVEGTREQGIVSGPRVSNDFKPELHLNFLSKEADLQAGTSVYSSGVGGVFPPGILLGRVKDVKKRELDATATLIPAVDVTNLEDVFVVLGKKQQANDE